MISAARLKDVLLGRILRVDMRLVVADAIAENYDVVADLNRAQLDRGETADGSAIVPFYKPVTVRIKQKKGQPTDRVTLKDRGSFYQSIRARRGADDEAELYSTDPKAERLVDHYGPTILGLSLASKAQLGQRLKPTIQDNYRKAIHA